MVRYELCEELGRIILDTGLDDEGVSTERAGLVAVGALLLLMVLRCLLGASEAACRSVDIRCMRGGSGDLAWLDFRDDACEDGLRGTMKP